MTYHPYSARYDFYNTRAELYGQLYYKLEENYKRILDKKPPTLFIDTGNEPTRKCENQALNIQRDWDPSGRLKVQDKKKFVEENGESPDSIDSLVLSGYVPRSNTIYMLKGFETNN